MAYKTLLETPEPRYEVASIAAKTGRSITHVYQRLRLAELIPDAAEVFQTNQVTAGHAVLIARLPQEQQKDALTATFREDWRTKEKNAIPVVSWRSGFARTSCSRWPMPFSIARTRSLCPPLGSVSRARNAPEPIRRSSMISPRTTVVWMRHASSPKSMLTSPARSSTPYGLIQITRAYYTNAKGEEKVLTRNEYTIIEPKEQAEAAEDAAVEQTPCSKATVAIIVEGPGKRGDAINTDEVREPDAAGFELRKRAQEATEPQLIRMLMELALLPSGWSDEPLEYNDPLASCTPL
jgi:hypothetical protein